MPDIPPPQPTPNVVSFDVPDGAWDTHFHVIDRSTGLVPERSYTPHDAGEYSAWHGLALSKHMAHFDLYVRRAAVMCVEEKQEEHMAHPCVIAVCVLVCRAHAHTRARALYSPRTWLASTLCVRAVRMRVSVYV